MINIPKKESSHEEKLRKGIKKLGGLCIKFFCPTFTGLPDRIVLMPGGRNWFIEMKATGKKPKPRQEFVHRQLRKLGFTVLVLDSDEKVKEFICSIQNSPAQGAAPAADEPDPL